jgi:hypothetical protein
MGKRLHSGTFAENWFAYSLELSADFAESSVLTVTGFAESWSILLKVPNFQQNLLKVGTIKFAESSVAETM